MHITATMKDIKTVLRANPPIETGIISARPDEKIVGDVKKETMESPSVPLITITRFIDSRAVITSIPQRRGRILSFTLSSPVTQPAAMPRMKEIRQQIQGLTP